MDTMESISDAKKCKVNGVGSDEPLTNKENNNNKEHVKKEESDVSQASTGYLYPKYESREIKKKRQEEEYLNQKREQAYKSLMHLLTQSQFYSNYMLARINKTDDKKKVTKRKKVRNENMVPSKKAKAAEKERNIITENALMKVNENLKARVSLNEDEIEKELLTGNDDNELGEEVPAKVESFNCRYFTGALKDYQVYGVNWMNLLYENGLHGILADEMGLGKTVQVIALFSSLLEKKQAGPYLIVVPLSTVPNWMSEFERFAPEIPVLLYYGSKPEKAQLIKEVNKLTKLSNGLSTRPIVVTTYETATYDKNYLNKWTWRYIVVDEGQRIKNFECQLIASLKSLKSLNRLLLTGTPLQNNVSELWSLLNFLLPDIFNDLDVFESWFDVKELQHKEGTDKFLRQEEEKRIIESFREILRPFMLRREKDQVCPDIPNKKELIVYAPMTELQNELYKAVLTHDSEVLGKRKPEPLVIENKNGQRPKRKCVLRAQQPNLYRRKMADDGDSEEELNEDVRKERELIDNMERFYKRYTDTDERKYEFLMRVKMINRMPIYRYIVNHPYAIHYPLNDCGMPDVNETIVKVSGKLLVLDAMLKKLHETKHKVLLFSTSTRILDIIEDYLSLRPWDYCRLDGSTKIIDRRQDIEAFNTNENIFLFLLSIRAGGIGINLAAADTVIIYDADWNPQVDIQAMARCHRIGQTRPVLIYKLCTKGTIDEIILNRSEAKRKLEKMVITKYASLLKANSDTIQELKNLLEKSNLNIVKPEHENELFTDQELETLLDRSELFEKGDSNKNENPKDKEEQSNRELAEAPASG